MKIKNDHWNRPPDPLDFYEYEACDLNKTFQITKNLIEKEDEKD